MTDTTNFLEEHYFSTFQMGGGCQAMRFDMDKLEGAYLLATIDGDCAMPEPNNWKIGFYRKDEDTPLASWSSSTHPHLTFEEIIARAEALEADQMEPTPSVFIVLYGCPTGGFRAFGPFLTADAAADWGVDQGEGAECVMEVNAPQSAAEKGLYPWDNRRSGEC